MTDPRFGAGDSGPGVSSPGPSSFPQPSDAPSSSFLSATAPAAPSSPASSSAFPPSSSAGSLSSPPEEIAAAAAEVFQERLALAGRYAELLGTEGVVRGLIGPREAPRLWERHLINCGVMSQIIPFGASVVDVGSGAGLPGIVLAVARPDLVITLVEPLARRTSFLEEVVSELGLDDTVTVLRGRAEEVAGDLPGADVVTARAVAALDKLAGWCLPLARVGGLLLAMKGASAGEEITAHREAVARLGGGAPEVRLCGVGLIDPPTTVVEVVKERHVAPGRARPARSSARGGPSEGASRGAEKSEGRRGGGRGNSRRR